MKKIFNNPDFWKIFVSIFLLGVSFYFPEGAFLRLFLLLISYLVVAVDLFISSFRNICSREFFDENTLMILATIGAFCIGEYPEAVMVVLLYRIGEALSDLAVDRSKDSVTELMDLKCDTIRLLIQEEEVIIDTKDAKVGDIFLVRPGEKIPLDGVIKKGEAFLDMASLTGESVPRKVKKGDSVLSGSICKDQVLVIEAEKELENSTANKILELLENSNEKKAKTEKFITRFAKIYTPIIVGMAVLIFVFFLIMQKEWKDAIYTACVFLVMSCPCALVISVPLAYFCGIGRASREGILVKGGTELEQLQKIETVAFDKTGTLTEGVFEVQKIVSPSLSQENLLEIAAYGEYHSNHPIAQSILKKYGKHIDSNKILDFEEISGKGVRFRMQSKTYYLGNALLMQEKGCELPEVSDMGTIVYVLENRTYLGYLVISDKIKESAYHVVSCLQEVGVKNFVMLSGDRLEIVRHVAKKVNIPHYYAGLLPEEKVEKVKEWKKEGCVAFLGDGMNDAPVMQQADVGIAMGGIGSDAAIEASDVVFMKDDISKLATAIKIAKYTNFLVLFNICFALGIKAIVLLLSLFGLGTIWLAVIADVGVTLLCVLHTLCILKRKF